MADHNHDTCSAPHSRNCEFANAAAERAVKKTFAIFGVDIEDPKQVSEFQESLRFADKFRRASDHGMLVLVGVVVTALIAAAFLGIKTRIGS